MENAKLNSTSLLIYEALTYLKSQKWVQPHMGGLWISKTLVR